MFSTCAGVSLPGSPIRDFVYSKDVAKGMMKVVEKGLKETGNYLDQMLKQDPE